MNFGCDWFEVQEWFGECVTVCELRLKGMGQGGNSVLMCALVRL